jgi:hypothetical protein
LCSPPKASAIFSLESVFPATAEIGDKGSATDGDGLLPGDKKQHEALQNPEAGGWDESSCFTAALNCAVAVAVAVAVLCLVYAAAVLLP